MYEAVKCLVHRFLITNKQNKNLWNTAIILNDWCLMRKWNTLTRNCIFTGNFSGDLCYLWLFPQRIFQYLIWIHQVKYIKNLPALKCDPLGWYSKSCFQAENAFRYFFPPRDLYFGDYYCFKIGLIYFTGKDNGCLSLLCST